MLDDITRQLQYFNPELVYLFGSQAKGTATEKSDIDLCIVVKTDNKKHLKAQLYYMIDSDKPIDFLVYTPEEWSSCIADKTSFAYKILTEGVELLG